MAGRIKHPRSVLSNAGQGKVYAADRKALDYARSKRKPKAASGVTKTVQTTQKRAKKMQDPVSRIANMRRGNKKK